MLGIDRDKNVGRVLYIVEGGQTEFTILIEDGMHSIERHSNLREAIKESDNDGAAS